MKVFCAQNGEENNCKLFSEALNMIFLLRDKDKNSIIKAVVRVLALHSNAPLSVSYSSSVLCRGRQPHL